MFIDLKKQGPTKSVDTIMNELNKQILNDILLNKVTKQISNENQNQNIDVQQQTKSISSDTIGNFKNLQKTFISGAGIIKYDQLYQQLSFDKNAPQKIFDFTQEMNQIQELKNNTRAVEEILQGKFDKLIHEIHEKKEQVATIRMNMYNNVQKIKNFRANVNY